MDNISASEYMIDKESLLSWLPLSSQSEGARSRGTLE